MGALELWQNRHKKDQKGHAMKTYTHSELVEAGKRWLTDKCGCIFCEKKSLTSEIPDVIGFNSSGSFVLEAKISRSDFFADKRKIIRKNPSKGMGDWRFYIAPKGLVKPSELPEGWGLVECERGKRPIATFNPFGRGNIYSAWKKNPKNESSEYLFMYSILRTIRLKYKD